MKARKWRGAMLYLAILGASATVYGARTYTGLESAGPVHTLHPQSSSPSRAHRQPSSSPKTSPKASKTPRASSAPVRGVTVNGSTVQTQYGPVQVAVTFKGSTITDVKALQTPSGDGRSRNIADRAVPTLHDEVIASQSAQIDSVSGATYTSDGYAQSVQSALDQH